MKREKEANMEDTDDPQNLCDMKSDEMGDDGDDKDGPDMYQQQDDMNMNRYGNFGPRGGPGPGPRGFGPRGPGGPGPRYKNQDGFPTSGKCGSATACTGRGGGGGEL